MNPVAWICGGGTVQEKSHLEPGSLVVQNRCVKIQLVVKNDVKSVSCKELHDVYKSVEQGIIGHVSVADSCWAALGGCRQVHAHPACARERIFSEQLSDQLARRTRRASGDT